MKIVHQCEFYSGFLPFEHYARLQYNTIQYILFQQNLRYKQVGQSQFVLKMGAKGLGRH